MTVPDRNPSSQISIEEMQRNLSAYLRRVKAGETLIVVQGGKAIAEIVPPQEEPSSLRPYGLCAGEFTVPDDLDAPLPENVIEEFEGQ